LALVSIFLLIKAPLPIEDNLHLILQNGESCTLAAWSGPRIDNPLSLGFNSHPGEQYHVLVGGQLAKMLPDCKAWWTILADGILVLHLLVSIICLSVDVCMVNLGDATLVPHNSDMPIIWTLSE
jgi:hypothetical protein